MKETLIIEILRLGVTKYLLRKVGVYNKGKYNKSVDNVLSKVRRMIRLY